MLKRFGSHSAVIGYEPVNEPWWNTDLKVLSDFYREVRKLVQFYAPQAYFVFHDSFNPNAPEWKVLFEDYTMTAMDHHGYMAFTAGYQNVTNTTDICEHFDRDNKDTKLLTPQFEVWQGEWAFATDTCAHWLLGFNTQSQAKLTTCSQVECPPLYFDCPSKTSTDCAVDKSIAVNGPFGVNQWNNSQTLIEKGMCWSDNNTTQNATGLQHIANCTVEVIDRYYNASFMWTAHNQIEAKWDYIKAYDLGWFKAKEWPANQWFASGTPASNLSKLRREQPNSSAGQFIQ